MAKVRKKTNSRIKAQGVRPQLNSNKKNLAAAKNKPTESNLSLKKTAKKKSISSVQNIQIVGIGASAGGLESFTQLLNHLTKTTGLALVFVQHLDPSHPSLATEILKRATDLPVSEIKDGEKVQPDHIYVLPPSFDLMVQNGFLQLIKRPSPSPIHKTIDHFFQSLAKDQGPQAVGIILSGTATDGTEGLRSIKAEGGITMAQSPKSAKFAGMPNAAIESGSVDFILPPSEIAQELLRISSGLIKTKQDRQDQPMAELGLDGEGLVSEDALSEIILLLKRKMKIDFSDYKKTTLSRRVSRRMVLLKVSSEREYARYLREHPEEITELCSEFLIHVTSFFRDPAAFTALKRKVFPEIVKNHSPGTPIRIWVPGCSSGEEAYSLAIALLDFLGDNPSQITIQVFASDISDEVIRKAREGFYSSSSVDGLSRSQLQRFFTEVGGGFKINKFVRDLCLFSKHNLISDPPFAKVDLVSCRNVLIYFTSNLQKRAMPIFHYALNPGGFLFLGHSESVGSFTQLFRSIDKTHKIYKKKPGISLPRIQFLQPAFASEKIKINDKKIALMTGGYDFQREADRIVAQKYGPSGVVINDNLEILQFRGRTVPFLEQPEGNASFKLLKMAHTDLVSDLRSMVRSAKGQEVSIRREGISFKTEETTETINIEVLPLKAAASLKDRQYLVLFEKSSEATQSPRGKVTVTSKSEKKNLSANQAEQRIQQLERQLLAGKEYQQSLSEDHEAAQEEITAANEELQSTNEELQSTNEELETAKEELQSTNEELVTVNEELQNRNTELGLINSDLVNLLSSIDIPIIIIGGDHRIRRFTPSAVRIFNLIPADIGRPIQDIRFNLEIEDIGSLISKVMSSLKTLEMEVQDRNSHWYKLQIRPYRTLDNRIDGVVLAFVDIEAFKVAIRHLKSALSYATSISDALQIPSIVLDRSLRVKTANKLFCKIFDVSAEKTEGQFLTDLGTKNWDICLLRTALENTILQNKPFKDFEVSSDFPGIGTRTFLLSARQIHWSDLPEPESIILSLLDITERKKIETALEESEEKYRALLESAHDAIVATDRKGLIQVVNHQTENWFGYSRSELIGKTVDILVPESIRSTHGLLCENYTINPTARPMGEKSNLFGQRKDGTTFPIEVSLSPVKTSKGLLVIALIRDVTWRRQLELERNEMLLREQSSREEAEKANRAKDVFLATLSHELRTPLSSILMWSQLIGSGKLDAEKVKQGAYAIEQGAKTQSQLIDDLLDISRIITGKLALKIEKVDPNPVILNAVESVWPLAEKKSIQVLTVLNKNVGLILADPIRLQQIIWNLLTNAIKFSEKGSTIQIQLTTARIQSKDSIQIQVIDHGKGIPPDFLPYIFNRFTQADSTSTRVHGGLGLGLSIVRNLVELLNGTVQAENAKEATGAIFTVNFPLVSGASAVTQQTLAPKDFQSGQNEIELSLDGLKILVVDDDESTRESLIMFLKSFGAEVAAADSAKAALIQFQSFKPHVLVSDIAMPDEDGYSLIKKIRGFSANAGGSTPALALTAFASVDDSERALNSGFQAHVAKPVEANDLAKVILKLARGSSKMG